MGVAKAWRFSLISANNLALLQDQNGNAISNSNTNKHVCWRSSATTSFQMKPISWSLVCGLMLFGLGLISLFTGHMASDLEWYSQRLVRPSLYSRLVIFFIFFTKLKGIGLELLQRICEILLLFVLINVPVLKVFAFLTLR
jgi:hypothetical protein